jgi:LuxR family maltose regulon positive regulatory protein
LILGDTDDCMSGSPGRQITGRTLERWFRWLDEQGAIERHPRLAVWRAFLSIATGQPVEAERWADVVDRWQYQDPVRADDPSTEAWAAGLRATLCRGGVEQMRDDADEAVQRCSGAGLVAPVTALLQGVARVLCGDLVGGDASLEDAVIGAMNVGAHEIAADALCERALVAIARRRWDQAEAHARHAETVLRQAGIEDIYTMALICAAQARVAMHRGKVPEAREYLVRAQRVRHLLTYAVPHFAVQARIELTHVHLALGDTAGARTLMRETDELLKRRPGLGTVVAEAQALRGRVAGERGPSIPGASSLTTAELRLMPMLATHLSFPEMAAQMFLSRNTVKSQAVSIYRKLGVASRSQAVARAREAGLLEG